MFKFNSNNIFTGYLKQLLASFNLPKFRVYTREQEQHAKQQSVIKAEIDRLQQRLNILSTLDAAENAIETFKAEKLSLERQLSKSATKSKSVKNALSAELDAATKLLEAEQNTSEQLRILVGEEVEDAEKRKIILAGIADELNKLTARLSPELHVIETTFREHFSVYPDDIVEADPINPEQPNTHYTGFPQKLRYVPYLKEGKLQEYVDGKWCDSHLVYPGNTHCEGHQESPKKCVSSLSPIYYSYGQKILNYTKNLKIQNTIYDSYTHEYLGDYLRFHRDYANIDLMPLYNCFSNRVCPRLNIEVPIQASTQLSQGYTAKFNTNDSHYKYYMVPVKFFKDYTLAIDSEEAIEVCCCIYGEYYNTSDKFVDLPRLTYQCFGNMQFGEPVLYSRINALNNLILKNSSSDLCQYEDDLKLIIKLPSDNKSSIVVLEGNYTNYYTTSYSTGSGENFQQHLSKANITVLNLDDSTVYNSLQNKLTTPLQLLRANTEESYPFADRLIEYLVGNAITVNEEIEDNIIRAKAVMKHNCPEDLWVLDESNGLWEPIMQYLAYSYINRFADTYDNNHDILGFIDKDTENIYAYTKYEVGQESIETELIQDRVKTIANIDIYEESQPRKRG